MTEFGWVDNALREMVDETAFPDAPELDIPLDALPARRARPQGLILAFAMLLVVVLAVPPVRSAVVDWIKAGAVTLQRWLGEEDLHQAPPADQFLSQVATRTSLAEAQAALPQAIEWPTRPDDLGMPDELWLLKEHSGPTVISIWRHDDGEARLALYQITTSNLIMKGVRDWEETQVNGQRAVWTAGPHLMRMPNDIWHSRALIEENVLIWWTDEGVTFRLETHASLNEAIAIAESLQAVPETTP